MQAKASKIIFLELTEEEAYTVLGLMSYYPNIREYEIFTKRASEMRDSLSNTLEDLGIKPLKLERTDIVS